MKIIKCLKVADCNIWETQQWSTVSRVCKEKVILEGEREARKEAEPVDRVARGDGVDSDVNIESLVEQLECRLLNTDVRLDARDHERGASAICTKVMQFG